MTDTFIRSAALALAASLLAAPGIAQAATADYTTSISPLVGFGYPYTGRLQLTVNADNIINGYYRPADNNDYVPVTGGRDGNSVWLDIGSDGRIHVNGTLQNGVITGTAYDATVKESYKFSAAVSK